MNYFVTQDTICSIITGGGMSAIAVIRISGKDSIKFTNLIFSKDISDKKTHSIHLGNIIDNRNIIDEVLVSIFKGSKSFTGEETVEISCHGSIYIQNKILQLLLEKGCRTANPGEFSMRAFKNGKLDLSQAESIADLIESTTKTAHKTALQQLKGGYSSQLQKLREQLINFASLIELELDFSEEDVEFADRIQLLELLTEIKKTLSKLIESFKLGNAIKNGIPVAILGAPNVGKSTLLNCLLQENKAIVSEIAGTTRDAIEDNLIIKGFNFRFIDTAGLRDTTDTIENIGIKRSLKKAKNASIILFLIDVSIDIKLQLLELEKIKSINTNKVIVILNKIDIPSKKHKIINSVSISAKNEIGLEKLKETLLNFVNQSKINENEIIVTNQRHYEELSLTIKEVNQIINGLNNNLSSDFLAINIRQALFHLGSITGEVNNEIILNNIFGNFCIGK